MKFAIGSKDKKQALQVYAIYKVGDVLRKKPKKIKITEAPQLKYKSTKIKKRIQQCSYESLYVTLTNTCKKHILRCYRKPTTYGKWGNLLCLLFVCFYAGTGSLKRPYHWTAFSCACRALCPLCATPRECRGQVTHGLQ